MSEELVHEQRGDVLILRLNRPEARNALNASLLHALGAALTDADTDPTVRVVVLTGTGDRAFCAGMDLREFALAGDPRGGEPRELDGFRRFIDGELSVPVVGAANATAVAGGLELLLACDLVVASSEARFGLPEVKRGLLAGGGGTFLGTRIPLAVALELTLTGDQIDAARAYEVGLVNRLAAPGDVLDVALDLATTIAANGPLAVAATKELVRLALRDDARARARVEDLVLEVFASEDAREGATAFIERRPPVWRGR